MQQTVSQTFSYQSIFLFWKRLAFGRDGVFVGIRDVSETVIFFPLKYALNRVSPLTTMG
jgi:hypothetical protein